MGEKMSSGFLEVAVGVLFVTCVVLALILTATTSYDSPDETVVVRIYEDGSYIPPCNNDLGWQHCMSPTGHECIMFIRTGAPAISCRWE